MPNQGQGNSTSVALALAQPHEAVKMGYPLLLHEILWIYFKSFGPMEKRQSSISILEQILIRLVLRKIEALRTLLVSLSREVKADSFFFGAAIVGLRKFYPQSSSFTSVTNMNLVLFIQKRFSNRKLLFLATLL